MATTMTKKQTQQLEQDQAREKLLEHYLTAGSSVYTLLRSRSASGMSRTMSVFVADGNQILDITYYTAQALGEKLVEVDGYRAIRQNGGGMDMGFNLVYNLSSVLFKGEERAGYILKQSWL